MFLIIATFTEGRSILHVDDHATENLRMMKSNLEQMHQEGRLSLLLFAAGISAQISRSVDPGSITFRSCCSTSVLQPPRQPYPSGVLWLVLGSSVQEGQGAAGEGPTEATKIMKGLEHLL